MPADPRFLEGWLPGRQVPKEASRLHVRLDAPEGITYAPDQLDPHTASRRLFVVPPLPEPPHFLYDFESEIRGREHAKRKEPAFVIGDEELDDETPAQQIAAAYRTRETEKNQAQDAPRTDTAPREASAGNDGSEADSQLSKEQPKQREQDKGTDSAASGAPRDGEAHKPTSDTKAPKHDKEQDFFADQAPKDAPEAAAKHLGTADAKVETDSNAPDQAEAQAAPSPVQDASGHEPPTMPGVPSTHTSQKTHESNQKTSDTKENGANATDQRADKSAEGPPPPRGMSKSAKKKAAKKARQAEAQKARETAKTPASSEKPASDSPPAQEGEAEPHTEQQPAATPLADAPTDPAVSPTPLDAHTPTNEPKAPKSSPGKEPAVSALHDREGASPLPASGEADAASSDAAPASNVEQALIDAAKPEAPCIRTETQEPTHVSSAMPAASHAQAATSSHASRAHPSEASSLPWPKPPVHRIPLADTASIRSAQSKVSTAASLAPSISQLTLTSDVYGSHPGTVPKVVHNNYREYSYQPPASIHGKKFGTHVWDAPRYGTLRSTESLAQQPTGRDAGSQWERVSGYGVSQPTDQAAQGPVSLDTVRALFVPDPRSWHPYRYVRRSDPRQVLLMAAGGLLTGSQLKAEEVAENVRGRDVSGVYGCDARSLASYFGTTENTTNQAGIGVVYSPSDALCAALDEPFDRARAETNLARRLERPPNLNRTTLQRAALRSVIAAIEYVDWEKEGFDKIVVAVHNAWIVRGISHDIWTWRHNGWRLTYPTPQGCVGEMVPNRDLWELLDFLVRQLEDIEYVRR